VVDWPIQPALTRFIEVSIATGQLQLLASVIKVNAWPRLPNDLLRGDVLLLACLDRVGLNIANSK